MNNRATPSGFHPVRRDRLLDQPHDAYKSKGKLPEPCLCPKCGALFINGRWRWGEATQEAQRELCPACHRIHDHYPAGFVTLEGDFFHKHRDEIMHLARHHEQREWKEHPLQRIMAIEEKDTGVQITTTDIHLARGLGEAIHHAYQGSLEFHYNPEDNLLRVHWSR